MRIIVIGQSPNKKYIKGKNGSIARLTRWLESINIKQFSFTNLSISNGPELNRIVTECQGYDIIVTLGKIADSALNKINLKHFALPHPSGLNRQINDKEFINDRLTQLSIYCRRRSASHA